MLTIKHLRQRIRDTNAQQQIVDVLKLSVKPEDLVDFATDEEIVSAFTQASIDSESLRSVLHSYPFPDFQRLGIYTGDGNPIYSLAGGFYSAVSISRLASEHGLPIENAKRVLDFGCGTSRILRYFQEFLPVPHYFGTEVFGENVDWGRVAFPRVTYIHQSRLPPLIIDDEYFDLIYAYSIFSHFDEPTHKAWLEELEKKLAPGGLMIVTIQSDVLLKRVATESELRTRVGMDAIATVAAARDYDRNGFAFRPIYDDAELSRGGLDATTFGLSFISLDYMKEHWTDRFEILSYLPGAISEFQDWVVLKKLNRKGLVEKEKAAFLKPDRCHSDVLKLAISDECLGSSLQTSRHIAELARAANDRLAHIRTLEKQIQELTQTSNDRLAHIRKLEEKIEAAAQTNSVHHAPMHE